MSRAVIIDAVRTPYGKRNGRLSGVHAVELLGAAQRGLLERHGLAPSRVTELVGGCVTQAGEQSNNITRFAWLHQGFDPAVAATTIDAQCASGQQSLHLVAAQIDAGVADVGLACGVEAMSRVPLLANVGDGANGRPRPSSWDVDLPTQFEGAERIAERRGLTRAELDRFGARSQQRAASAWHRGDLDRQVIPVADPDGALVTRDEGLRTTTAEGLSVLDPVLPGGVHTAGTASQISDGAAAALLMSQDAAHGEGLVPRGRIVAQCLVGGEPEYLLDGPVQAADRLLARTGMTIADIDLFEINEAFAAVPLSAARVHGIPEDRLNVNGGAIALGHPVGSTGIRLIAALLDELERRDAQFGMALTCAGGAMAVGTLVERLS